MKYLNDLFTFQNMAALSFLLCFLLSLLFYGRAVESKNCRVFIMSQYLHILQIKKSANIKKKSRKNSDKNEVKVFHMKYN